MTNCRVVWAAQSPTLLNLLATSKRWDVSVALFGDTDQLAEMAQLKVPLWDGNRERVRYAFVCSPDQIANAKHYLPRSEIVLVAHHGIVDKLPSCPEANAIVTFTEKVAMILRNEMPSYSRLANIRHIYVIRPPFVHHRTWSWKPSAIWTMRSRPSARDEKAMEPLLGVLRRSRIPIQLYGQNQPNGYLGQEEKIQIMRYCSAYISALHSRAGLGLAEHEAMACGCPVIGFRWGDIELACGAGDFDLSESFFPFEDYDGFLTAMARVALDEQFACSVAEKQREYLCDHNSAAAYDSSLKTFLCQ